MSPQLDRRALLLGAAAAALAVATRSVHAAAFEVTHTDAEWQKLLSADQYAVLRQHNTERKGTSPLLHEKRPGTYSCAGCALPLYSSAAKYDSGTGWPSFFAALPDAIGTEDDSSLFATRTEIHCRRCGGHLGHLFDDGPQPTGKRHCLNGLALKFSPSGA